MGNCVSDVVKGDILHSNSRSSGNSSQTNSVPVHSFRVYIHRRNKFIHAWLRVSSENITIELSKSDVTVFPLQFLRRYGYTSAGIFFFESGRRCTTGEGLHTYQTQHADTIFRLVQNRVQDTANATLAEASMRHENRMNRESSLGIAEHTPRIHPVQRYSSEGNANISGSSEGSPQTYHSLHAGEARRRKVILPPPPRPRSLPGTNDHRTLVGPQGHAQIIGNIISESTVASSSRKSSAADVWNVNPMGHSYANWPNNNFEHMPYRPRCPSACSTQSTISSHSYSGSQPTTPTTKVFPMQWDGGAGSTSFLCYANTTPATRMENTNGKYINMQDVVVSRPRCLTIPSSGKGIPIDERRTPSPTTQLNYAAVDVLPPEERAPSRLVTIVRMGVPMAFARSLYHERKLLHLAFSPLSSRMPSLIGDRRHAAASAAAAGPFASASAFAVNMGALCCRTQVHGVEESHTEVVASPSNKGRLLVFVNPNSGSGKGVKTFRQKVHPKLLESGIAFELVITHGPQHAMSIVRDRNDLGQFNAILILSGDGLVFEVLNGLCERADRSSILPALPIGIVPSGSGNGLLSSVFASRGQSLKSPAFMRNSIDVATSVNSVAQPVNLLHVQTDTQNMPAFLSIGWGLLADIDTESEQWRRSLGSNRFVLSAVVRCLRLRTYRGRLSYQPYRAGSIQSSDSYSVFAKTTEKRMVNTNTTAADSANASPSTRPLDSEWTQSHLVGGAAPLEEAIPGDWTTLDDEFVFVYALSISHISADGPMMPRARLLDDRIYLTYALKKDVSSKIELLKFLIAMESEKHLDFDFFKTVEVSSFRLETTDNGVITVDGEVVNTKNIQTTVTNLSTAIMAQPMGV